MKYYALHLEDHASDDLSPFCFMASEDHYADPQISSDITDLEKLKIELEELHPERVYTIISFEVKL